MNIQAYLYEFEDWLINGPAGKWPSILTKNRSIGDAQRAVIKRNAELLLRV
ncbi:MAG: hypothetical protein JKX91_15740 [Rhizobiaceae bacterium]|nr:hypothetical protein [Rhizobiaceae bacterium]